MKLHVHVCKIRKLHPAQRATVEQCCEQLFDQSNFEAMKTLSGWELHAVISIFVLNQGEYLSRFQVIVGLQSGLNKEDVPL